MLFKCCDLESPRCLSSISNEQFAKRLLVTSHSRALQSAQVLPGGWLVMASLTQCQYLGRLSSNQPYFRAMPLDLDESMKAPTLAWLPWDVLVKRSSNVVIPASPPQYADNLADGIWTPHIRWHVGNSTEAVPAASPKSMFLPPSRISRCVI